MTAVNDRFRRAAGVLDVDVDGERVVVSPTSRQVVHLDPIASVLWRLFDGTATLGDLSTDVSDVWRVSSDEALNSVQTLVDHLVAAQMLDRVPDGQKTHAACS